MNLHLESQKFGIFLYWIEFVFILTPWASFVIPFWLRQLSNIAYKNEFSVHLFKIKNVYNTEMIRFKMIRIINHLTSCQKGILLIALLFVYYKLRNANSYEGLSTKNKIIFIKTHKTASTCLQVRRVPFAFLKYKFSENLR